MGSVIVYLSNHARTVAFRSVSELQLALVRISRFPVSGSATPATCRERAHARVTAQHARMHSAHALAGRLAGGRLDLLAAVMRCREEVVAPVCGG